VVEEEVDGLVEPQAARHDSSSANRGSAQVLRGCDRAGGQP